jgi:hypothetical protein
MSPTLPLHLRILLAAVAGTVTVLFPPEIETPFVVLCLWVATWPRRTPALPGDHALRHHLATCRRRGRPADVVVARVPGAHPHLASELRITDSAMSEVAGGHTVLTAVVDRHELSRAGLVRRLAEPGGDVRAGWAAFPEDGATLDALVDVAARSCITTAASLHPTPSPRRS